MEDDNERIVADTDTIGPEGSLDALAAPLTGFHRHGVYLVGDGQSRPSEAI